MNVFEKLEKELADAKKEVQISIAEATRAMQTFNHEVRRGIKNAKNIDPKHRKLFWHPLGSTAVHESGHALVCWRSPSTLRINSVVIDKTGGRVRHNDTRIPTNVSRWYEIALVLAGVAAEIELYGHFSATERRNDLLKALGLAKQMVSEGHATDGFPWTEQAAVKTITIDSMYKHCPSTEVCTVLESSFRHARAVIVEHRDNLLKLSDELLERRKMNHDDIIAVLGPRPFDERLIF